MARASSERAQSMRRMSISAGSPGPAHRTVRPAPEQPRWTAGPTWAIVIPGRHPMKLPVFVSQQAGKPILTGTLSAQEIITALQDGTMAVNPAAQRSLARGAGKESTRELLEADRAHKTARMAELVRFYLRVMECVEHGQQGQGFFGAIQLIIPSRFTGARLRFVEPDTGSLPAGVTVALGALGRSRSLATLEADPALGETVFDISDGQGRC